MDLSFSSEERRSSVLPQSVEGRSSLQRTETTTSSPQSLDGKEDEDGKEEKKGRSTCANKGRSRRARRI